MSPFPLLWALWACGGPGDSGTPGECPGAHDPGLPQRTGTEVCTTDRVASWPEPACDAAAACQVHADCTAEPGGRCQSQGTGSCGCAYDACTTDADCRADEACMCGEDPVITGWAVNTCVPTHCRSAADCPEGEDCVIPREAGYCDPSLPPAHDSPTCSSPDDMCRSNEACTCSGAGDVCAGTWQILQCSDWVQMSCD